MRAPLRALRFLAPAFVALAFVPNAHAATLAVADQGCAAMVSEAIPENTITSQALPRVNGVTGFKGSGNCTLSSNVFGEYEGYAYWAGYNSDLEPRRLSESTALIPVEYDFHFTGGDSLTGVDWSLELFVDGEFAGGASGSSGLGEMIKGSFTASIPTEFESFYLLLGFGAEADESVEGPTLHIPENSIDVNPAGAEVPEPGMFALAGTGLLALAAYRRLRG